MTTPATNATAPDQPARGIARRAVRVSRGSILWSRGCCRIQRASAWGFDAPALSGRSRTRLPRDMVAACSVSATCLTRRLGKTWEREKTGNSNREGKRMLKHLMNATALASLVAVLGLIAVAIAPAQAGVNCTNKDVNINGSFDGESFSTPAGSLNPGT